MYSPVQSMSLYYRFSHSLPFSLLFLFLPAHFYLGKVLNIFCHYLFGDNVFISKLSNSLTVSTDYFTFFKQSFNLCSRLEVVRLTAIGGVCTPTSKNCVSLFLFLVHPCPFSSFHRTITRHAINYIYFVRRSTLLYDVINVM